MKTILLFALALTSVSVFAQSLNPRLLKNIAIAVDALHSDTINEGEMSAWVNEVNGAPDMECTLARYREAGKGVARCQVTFEVESQYTGETDTCLRECFLIHIYDLRTLKILDRVESLSQSCLEDLSSGCD